MWLALSFDVRVRSKETPHCSKFLCDWDLVEQLVQKYKAYFVGLPLSRGGQAVDLSQLLTIPRDYLAPKFLFQHSVWYFRAIICTEEPNSSE
jgi:hypothetical protein